MKRVCVVGLGYIGLPTALILAANGIDVAGVDINKELVANLCEGNLAFEEAGLDLLLLDAMANGILFTESIMPAEMYIIAVPTPYETDSKRINPIFLIKAINNVLEVCPDQGIIIVESTISPGTIDRYVRPIINEKCAESGIVIHIAHAPERILPGRMIYELEHNPRTLGVDDEWTGQQVKELYKSFCEAEIVITDVRSAELIKIVENTFRDVNIAFANELCKICRKEDINVYEIIRIANMHPRVNILQPGPGVGGHCISVDPWFLVGDHPDLSLLIHEARNINNSMPDYVLSRARDIMLKHDMQDITRVGVYGLTYKEDINDTRESPTLQMFDRITRHLGQLPKVYDPMLNRDIVPGQYHDFDSFLADIDFIIIMVGHSHIREHMVKLKGKIILDTRNVCAMDDVYKI